MVVIHVWLEPPWTRMLALGERLPHALLITGAAGLGKRDFAEALAARLLCEHPLASGEACGTCLPCRWRLSGNHPDLHRLVPESEAGEGAEEGEGTAGEGKEKAGAENAKAEKTRSSQILIDQVRAVQEALTLTAHHGGRRVVIVDPAEAMNAYTANALLKLLEEPPPGCTFLLVSPALKKLLPTIRSRCQQWPMPRPDAGQLRRWQAGTAVSGRLLAVTGGTPLAAERLAAQGVEALLARFVADLCAADFDPLRLAGQWESWLKKDKVMLAAGIGLVTLVDWMQRWVSDLVALRLGGRVRYFPAEQQNLSGLAARMSVAGATSCYNDLINIRRVSAHPLNLRLFLEDMLLRYTRGIKGGQA
ncbi:DNA polymerase III subunit delta' [Betaproteobacteria bacterium]|nr:DNA polymerase III subunit delta' [Betaproteobacteria bacterium]